MTSLRLVWTVSALLVVAHQIVAISEDTKAALNEACDKDLLQPINERGPSVERCKAMIAKIPEDVNGRIDMYSDITALQTAAAMGLVEVTKALIAAGADVNKVNRAWGVFDTALFLAAKLGRPRVCEVLLNAGADINMKNDQEYGQTALEMAMENNQNEVVDVLKKHGATVPHWGLAEILEFHGLSSASEINEFAKKEALVQGQPKRFTPLMFAAEWGKKEVVALLLDAGADVNFPPGGYPMFSAIDSGSAEIVKMLLDAGAVVNPDVDPNIKSMLMMAVNAEKKNKDVVKLLIDAGAALDETNGSGETALYVAANGEQKEIARMLVEAGADTTIRPNKTYWKTEQNMRYLEQLNQEINNQ